RALCARQQYRSLGARHARSRRDCPHAHGKRRGKSRSQSALPGAYRAAPGASIRDALIDHFYLLAVVAVDLAWPFFLFWSLPSGLANVIFISRAIALPGWAGTKYPCTSTLSPA